MASSRVTRGSILRLTGLPLMFRVTGTGPGPETPAAGAASAGRSSRPVPAAPIPTPPRNPRRLNPVFVLVSDSGVFFKLTRHLPFLRRDECGTKSSQLYQKEGQPGEGWPQDNVAG